MPKLKRLPKTKKQLKYLGPYTLSKVTKSHVTISKTELRDKKHAKIHIHITRPCFPKCFKKPRKTKKEIILNYSIGFKTL